LQTLLAALLAAVLVLAPAIVAVGAEADGVSGLPICSVDHPGGAPSDQAPLGPHHVHACCLLGCCTTLHGLPASDAEVVPAPRLRAVRQAVCAQPRGARAEPVRAYAARAPPVSG
jgi:hypothetical protein